MIHISEKTKSLLFAGAQSNVGCVGNNFKDDDYVMGIRDLPSKPLPGQITHNSCGTLFCPAQTLPVQLNNNNNVSSPPPQPPSAAVQMHIDQTTGKLCRAAGNNYFFYQSFVFLCCLKSFWENALVVGTPMDFSSVATPASTNSHSCHACRQSIAPVPSQICSFCEKTTCVSCLRACCSCNFPVCTICSTIK